MADKGRIILLVGPTGVGKTGAAVLMARALGTEVISADSMQIYRHMDIGTEKPSPVQMGGVRHHMIDVAEPAEGFSAGKFIDAVVPIIEGLHARGAVPIVAGGTGLYVKAMTRGIFDGPKADEALRDDLRMLESVQLHERLRALDPVAADTIMPQDKRRIIRALEVCLLAGGRLSELRAVGTSALPYQFVKIALRRQREELYAMIDRRVDEMMERGLVDEVRRVLAMNPGKVAMQAIGYKEVAAYLEGQYSLERAVELVKRNTRRYAKRQFTWFAKEPALNWVDITGLTRAEDVVELLWPILRREGILP